MIKGCRHEHPVRMRNEEDEREDGPNFNYPEAKISQLIQDIYDGKINPRNLPDDLYNAIADVLASGVEKGMGNISVEFGEEDEELAAALQENIYLFSAAKTFQQTLEMSEALVDDEGNMRDFEDFKKECEEIFTRYNGGELDGEIKPGWLEAEYNTAISQANHAKKWNRIEKQKDIFPYLLRNEVDDSAECEMCAAVNGLCRPVDDPIWDELGGELHFNCRGIVEQVEKEEGEDKEWEDDDVDDAMAEADMDDNFKFNPGKKQEVFSTSGKSQHPYFSVPKEYQEFAEHNFGLEIKRRNEKEK